MSAFAPTVVDTDWLSQPGEHEIETTTVCVLTRFGLARPWHLLPTLRDYRRVAREAVESRTRGLLESAFLVESPTSCYSFSIWADKESALRFHSLRAHQDATAALLGRLANDTQAGFDVWSTMWRLVAVSNNLFWPNFDLRNFLLETRATATGLHPRHGPR